MDVISKACSKAFDITQSRNTSERQDTLPLPPPLPLAMQDWRLNTEKKMHGPGCIAWRSPDFVSRIRKIDSEPKKILKGQLIFIIPTWFICSNNRQHLSVFIKDEHAVRGLTFI